MKQLVETSELRRLIAQEREAIDTLTRQHRAELVLLGVRAIENVRTAVQNPDHPKCLEMSRFLLDKILPSKTTVEADVSLKSSTFAARADAELRAFAEEISEILPHLQVGREIPHVVSGEDAIPKALEPRRRTRWPLP